MVLHTTFLSGSKCVIMSKWDLEKACQLIQRYRLTCAYVPPPIVLALSKQPVVSHYDLSSIRWINAAAAPVSRELVDAVWARLKIGVEQGYGLLETSPTCTTQFVDEWSTFQGSVGKLFPNMTAKIVDPDGNEVPQGKVLCPICALFALGVTADLGLQTGELLLKGPYVFQGYWKRPDLQKEVFTNDGWFKTGDVFCIDDKGNFYITDRIKELIKYSKSSLLLCLMFPACHDLLTGVVEGFQVPPAELENKLPRHEKILDVCVIGVWSKEEHTEVPRAYVVLKPGNGASDELAQEISAWLSTRVAPPKRLRGGVRFIKTIPKTPSGKILRRVIKDQVKREEAELVAKL